MMYGSHESTQSIEVGGDDGREIEFNIVVTCTSTGCEAQLYGPPENCYPSEAPEFELDTIHVIDEQGNPYLISELVLDAFVGTGAALRMVEKAITDAVESGDF